jgi:glycosyltransferase involved in cell wall biosynthesis
MNRISVVIPTYNGARFIRETLESVFAQTRLPEEVLVVDDASTDTTVQIVEEMASLVPLRVRVIRLERNSGGPATPINIGIQAAEGELIALLDQDDLMLPEKLAMQYEALERHPEVDLALSDYERFDAEGEIEPSETRLMALEAVMGPVQNAGPVHVVDAITCLTAFVIYCGLPASCSNHFFRKTFWQRAGGFDPRPVATTDYEFLTRAIRGPVVWIDRVLMRKRKHPKNLARFTIQDRLDVLKAQRELVARYRDAKELRDRVADQTQSLAEQLRWDHRYFRSLEVATILVFLDHPGRALKEWLKTLAAIPRDILCRTPRVDTNGPV